MEEIRPKLTVRDVFGYVIAYLCWFSTAAAGLLAVFQSRNALNVIWPVLGGSRWVLRAVDRFGLVFLGLVWLVYVIFVEQHYRSAITAVRVRRGRAQQEAQPLRRITPRSQGAFMRFLERLGLDILATRFLVTLMLPLVLFVVTYLTVELGFRSLR